MHCKPALFLTVTGSALVALATSAGAQSFTTRIVTHDYSGAIVSREHGVRVIRPLPPERQVIINPDRVPLSLSYSDTRIYGYATPSRAGDAGAAGGTRYGPDGEIYSAPAWGRGLRGHRGFNHFNGHFNGRRGGMPGAHPGTPGFNHGAAHGFSAVR